MLLEQIVNFPGIVWSFSGRHFNGGDGACHPRNTALGCCKPGRRLVKILSSQARRELCDWSSAVLNLSHVLIPNVECSRLSNAGLPWCIHSKGKVHWYLGRSKAESLSFIDSSEMWSLYNHTFSGISKLDSYLWFHLEIPASRHLLTWSLSISVRYYLGNILILSFFNLTSV